MLSLGTWGFGVSLSLFFFEIKCYNEIGPTNSRWNHFGQNFRDFTFFPHSFSLFSVPFHMVTVKSDNQMK